MGGMPLPASLTGMLTGGRSLALQPGIRLYALQTSRCICTIAAWKKLHCMCASLPVRLCCSRLQGTSPCRQACMHAHITWQLLLLHSHPLSDGSDGGTCLPQPFVQIEDLFAFGTSTTRQHSLPFSSRNAACRRNAHGDSLVITTACKQQVLLIL